MTDTTDKKITPEDFMAFYRDDNAFSELSCDARVEVFLGVLTGNSDITKELLDELLSDYDGGSYDENLEVINYPEWSTEAPTAPGDYWFYGWPYGKDPRRPDDSPEWCHVTIRTIANGHMTIRDGHFWDPTADDVIGKFMPIVFPQTPELDALPTDI